MTRPGMRIALGTLCLGAATALTPPSWRDLREVASWLARPAVLPFAWNAVNAAQRHGDANEVFARAQQVLRWLPTWTDGHMVFAYRFAVDDGAAHPDPAVRAQQALQRLDIAMAWLEQTRSEAGRHEVSLLQTLSFLPIVAELNEPGLHELLQPRGGAAQIADHYLALAEARTNSAALREQRTFFAPHLAGALLESGSPEIARRVLQVAIERSRTVRDGEVAGEWRTRMIEVCRWLDGDHSVDLSLVRDDPRFTPLLPHLH